MGGGDHWCEWRERVGTLEAELAAEREKAVRLESLLAKLQRHMFGRRSEKMPSIAQELRRSRGIGVDAEATLVRRRENAEKMKALPARVIHHRVPDDERNCPRCGGDKLTPLGQGKVTTVYELVPVRIERQVHVQEKLRCRCGSAIVTAPGAPRAFEYAGYGPAFIAHVVVAKCADAIPLYRLAKRFQRDGVPIQRSTLVGLFHRAAEELAPIVARLLAVIAANEIVQGDETPLRALDVGKTRRVWIWTFIARDADGNELIAFCYSPSRSGDTPARVLGGSKGKLVVDGYTGYNRVITPEGRVRAGCLAHVRRRFYDALPTAPAARQAIELILDVYQVERAASDGGIAGTEAHLALRRDHSRKAMDTLHAWLETERPRHLPKSPMGDAIGYALGQWPALVRFLEDARVPVDNNASERALRAAALGRKNWLFVGHDAAGENLAGLFSLVATCEANGINAAEYLADVLLRVQTHPASRIDELLPHVWKQQCTAPCDRAVG